MANEIHHRPPDARRVILAVNPCAGARSRQDLIQRLAKVLTERGLEVEAISDREALLGVTSDPVARQEIRAVVAAGGAGTIAHVANIVPPGTPLAILPLGTENLLSKYLHVTTDPAQLANTIAEGLTVELDAGQAGDRLFLLMAGCGFDAEVVRRMHAQRQGRHINHLSYAKPILEAIRNYEYPELRVTCRDVEGKETSLTACWVFVVNVPRYAGGLAISPDAVANDGLLNVCTFKAGSFWNGLIYLSGVYLGQHQNWNDFCTLRAAEVRIEAGGEVPYQLDGDPGGVLPLDIKILPRRLTLLVAQEWARHQGFLASGRLVQE